MTRELSLIHITFRCVSDIWGVCSSDIFRCYNFLQRDFKCVFPNISLAVSWASLLLVKSRESLIISMSVSFLYIYFQNCSGRISFSVTLMKRKKIYRERKRLIHKFWFQILKKKKLEKNTETTKEINMKADPKFLHSKKVLSLNLNEEKIIKKGRNIRENV